MQPKISLTFKTYFDKKKNEVQLKTLVEGITFVLP